MAVQIHHAPRHITTLKPAQTLDLIKTAAIVFLSQYKRNILFTFLSTFILQKFQKSPFYKGLKEKIKHKNDKKKKKRTALYIHRKIYEKHCPAHNLKKLKTPIL